MIAEPIAFHLRAWAAYRSVTQTYRMTERSKASTLILYSPDDHGYPQNLYEPYLKNWAATDLERRQLWAFRVRNPQDAHDGWNEELNVKENGLYDKILQTMVDFLRVQVEAAGP